MDNKNSDAKHISRSCFFFNNVNVSKSGGYVHTDDNRCKECWYLYDQRLGALFHSVAHAQHYSVYGFVPIPQGTALGVTLFH